MQSKRRSPVASSAVRLDLYMGSGSSDSDVDVVD